MATSYLNLKINGELVKDIILQRVSVTQALNDHWRCHTECRHTQDQRASSADADANSPITVILRGRVWLRPAERESW